MRFSFRAAALSAVIMSCCGAAAVADPSVASEAEAAPTAAYIDHAASGLSAENLGLNDLEDSASAARLPKPKASAHRDPCDGARFPERDP